MATINRFEELEVWQLARQQVKDFNILISGTSLNRDFALRNQMNASSGSVMDCIAEGFERSGKNEFKNFLLIAKGSNGEFRSQLYRCLDREHINETKFNELVEANILLGNKLMALVKYLQKTAHQGFRYKLEKQQPTLPVQNEEPPKIN